MSIPLLPSLPGSWAGKAMRNNGGSPPRGYGLVSLLTPVPYPTPDLLDEGLPILRDIVGDGDTKVH